MKRILFTAAILFAASSSSFAACNPAVSNWVNASPITCPFDSGNGLKKHVVKFTPTPIKHWCHDEEGRKPRGMKGEKGSRGEEGPKGPPRPRNT
jgi:hypothetical protein